MTLIYFRHHECCIQADINFVGLVLNRNITKKLRLYFIVKALTCVVFVSLFTSFN